MDEDGVVHPHPAQALAPHHVDLRGKNPGVHGVLCQVALQLAKQALALAWLHGLSVALRQGAKVGAVVAKVVLRIGVDGVVQRLGACPPSV